MKSLSLLSVNLFVVQYPFFASGEQKVLNVDASVSPDARHHFSLPSFDEDPENRIERLQDSREGFQYGAPLLGNTSAFPAGVLGDAMVQRDKSLWLKDVMYVTEEVNNVEIPQAASALDESGGLRNLSSFRTLYEGQWKSSLPEGVALGTLTNSTQDLFFSMERLTTNPYSIRRLFPGEDSLSFHVDDTLVQTLTATTDLQTLLTNGRLFFVDHSIQASYPTNPGRYTTACSAYFFIHPESHDFLPLAIKTDVDDGPIYTPLDNENDWLLAKMAFNMNDLFHGQLYHLAATHDVAEPVHLAALRTLSDLHPIRGFLDRVMYQAYAVRQLGEEVLFNPGGFFDQFFAINNIGGRNLTGDLYHTSAGRFQFQYFTTDLRARGMIDCEYGPPLKHLPFYDDVAPLLSSIQTFAQAYVDAYYPSEDLLRGDDELQAWIAEVQGPAKVLDFPSSPLLEPEVLVSILTHMAFLAGVAHHVLNAATPAESSGVLPMHPSSFFRPLPTAKGQIKDIMDYVPNESQAVTQASLLVRFSRPLIEEQGRSLLNMWTGPEFLARVPIVVRLAAVKFRASMIAISEKMQAKRFDEDGLCQGMPLIWQSLDPRRIPYYLSV